MGVLRKKWYNAAQRFTVDPDEGMGNAVYSYIPEKEPAYSSQAVYSVPPVMQEQPLTTKPLSGNLIIDPQDSPVKTPVSDLPLSGSDPLRTVTSMIQGILPSQNNLQGAGVPKDMTMFYLAAGVITLGIIVVILK